MQKKNYIALSTLFFLGYIIAYPFIYFFNESPSSIIRSGNIIEHAFDFRGILLKSVVIFIAFVMTVWGTILMWFTYRHEGKKLSLALAILLNLLGLLWYYFFVYVDIFPG